MINFDQTIIDAVHEINTKLQTKVVFAGSFGLKYNGLITRTIHDLDVFTEDNLYGTKESEELLNRSSSGNFWVKGKHVSCVHGSTSNGIGVDYMFKKDCPLEFDEVDFYGVKIKIEKPEHAINAKRDYAHCNSEQFLNRQKHEDDLRYIEERKNDDIPY